MKVVGTRYIQAKRKFTTDEHQEGYTRNPVYQFKELEAIVRSWPVTKQDEEVSE